MTNVFQIPDLMYHVYNFTINKLYSQNL